MSVNVLLPCDLPSWEAIQERLWTIQNGKKEKSKQMRIMVEIRELSDFSFTDDKKARKSFEDFAYVVEKRFNDSDKKRFFGQTLPYMARYAMSLKELAPRKKRRKKVGESGDEGGGAGLCYSLSKTNETTSLDRRFVASLIANAFFSTFPKRDTFPGLIVPNFRFEDLFGNLRRSFEDGLRFKNLLNYFSILEAEDAYGFVHFTRYYEGRAMENFSTTRSVPLCSVFITSSEDMFNLSVNSQVIIRDNKMNLKSSSVLQHPEALAALCFMDNLIPGEYLKISGLLSTGGGSPHNSISERQEEEDTYTWNNCKIRLLDTSESFTKNTENLMKELNRYSVCFEEDKGEDDIRQIRSESSVRTADFSSKSSLLDDLLKFSPEKKKSEKISVNGNYKKKNKLKPKRTTFSERLKAALARGNTPDSMTTGSRRGMEIDLKDNYSTSISEGDSDGFLRDSPDSKNDASSSDYSFDYVGGDFDVDLDYEEICRNLFHENGSSSSKDERRKLIKSLAKTSRRRALSDSYEKSALKLQTEALIESPLPKTHFLRRTSSFLLEERILLKPSVKLSPEDDNYRHSEEFVKPVWIVNPPGPVDPNRFLIQWISVSLAQIPLVIYQVSDGCSSLQTIEKICSVIESRGWGTKELMNSLSKYFSDNTTDIIGYINELS